MAFCMVILQAHNRPLGIRGELCPTISQLERALYRTQDRPYNKTQQLNRAVDMCRELTDAVNFTTTTSNVII